MDMFSIAGLRKSVRNFTKKTFDENTKKEIIDFFAKCEKFDESIKTEVKFFDKKDLPEEAENNGGYNGFLIEAPYYIAVYSEKKTCFIENAGYMGENIIFKLTSMGIDSCWITLKQDYVISQPDSKMRLTGLIAAGYGAKFKNPKIINKMIWGKGYDNLKVVNIDTDNKARKEVTEIVYMNEYGNNITMDELSSSGIEEGFYAARHAPSALNRQPWRFILDNEFVVLVIKKDEYTNIYEAKIDAGTVMFNFAAVITERVFKIKWVVGKPEKNYKIPDDCVIAAYCHI